MMGSWTPNAVRSPPEIEEIAAQIAAERAATSVLVEIGPGILLVTHGG
ncbi:MAG TPA: hypothetical protein VID68_10490 [Solirubrobacteraceae bacterium]|jgi:hypothetical protein